MNVRPDDGVLVTLLLVDVFLAVATATVLVAWLPTHVKLYLGESSRWLECWTGLLVIVVTILLPINLFLGFIHNWLIPLPMGAEAVITLFTDPAHMDGIRMEYEKWFASRGGNTDSARQIEILLWRIWPLLAVAGVVLLAIGVKALKRFYVRLGKDLETHAISVQFGKLFDERLQRSTLRYHRRRRRRHHRRHHRGDATAE